MGSRSPGIGVLRRAEIFVVHGPPAAMAAKPYLRAALLYAQEEARVYERGGHGEPTIESPREFVWHYKYLPATVVALLIFDATSGKIVQRFPNK